MQTLRATEPVVLDRLTVTFLELDSGSGGDSGAAVPAWPRFLPLEEALQGGCLAVRETGEVPVLEVENLGAIDILILAGDLVKGGRQDRTFARDCIVPAHAGAVRAPVHCVESGRWGRRSREEDHVSFKAAPSMVSPSIRRASRARKSQGAVWDETEASITAMSASVREDVAASASPSSYLLASEHESVSDVLLRTEGALLAAARAHPAALGLAAAIDGRWVVADIFPSPQFLQSVLGRLARSLALDLLARRPRAGAPAPHAAPSPATLLDLRSRLAALPPRVTPTPPCTEEREAVLDGAHYFSTRDLRTPTPRTLTECLLPAA